MPAEVEVVALELVRRLVAEANVAVEAMAKQTGTVSVNNVVVEISIDTSTIEVTV